MNSKVNLNCAGIMLLTLVLASTAPLSSQTPPQYRTDLAAAPETVPPLCTPTTPSANCQITSSDLNPNVEYFRVTNPNSLAPQYTPRQFAVADTVENAWSRDDSAFLVLNPNGSVVPFALSTAGPLTTQPIACHNSDPFCSCNQTSPSCAVSAGVVNIDGNAVFSKETPKMLIAPSYNGGAWAFNYVDLSPTMANPSASTTVTSMTPAMNSCDGIQIPAGSGIGYINVSHHDRRLAISTGGAADGEYGVIYVWDTEKQACRFLDINRMTVGGDAHFGSAAGAVQLIDEDGAALPPTDSRYQLCSTDGAPAPACMHTAQILPGGARVVFSTSLDNYAYTWEIGTPNVYLCGINAGSYTCTGDAVVGFAVQLNLLNSSESLIQAHDWKQKAATPSPQLYPVASEPAGFGDYAWANHANWNNVKAENGNPNQQPFLFLPWSPYAASYPPAVGWADELVLGYATGSTTAYRLAHTYNRALTNDLGIEYYDQGLPQISHDGKYAIFGSSWGGTNQDTGNSACTSTPCYRTDVFLVQVPAVPQP